MRNYSFRITLLFQLVFILGLPFVSIDAQELPDSLKMGTDTISVIVDNLEVSSDTILNRLDPLLSETDILKATRYNRLILSDTIRPEVLDSLTRRNSQEIYFNQSEAIDYISAWYNDRSIWNNADDPLRSAMGRFLYEATNDQFYISEWYVNAFEWENIKIPTSSFFLWDTLHIILPQRPQNIPIEKDSITGSEGVDTLQIVNIPPVSDNNTGLTDHVRKDSIILVISDTLSEVISSNQLFPFSYYNYPMTGDSIQAAMQVLGNLTHTKDSSRVVFTGSKGSEPIWLSDEPNQMTRLWLMNEFGQELSIWLGSPSRDSVSVIVEKGVHFRRPNKETRIAETRVGLTRIDNSTLADPQKIEIIPQYWKFLSEASFVFNQAIIKNWSKGGQSNVSTLLDLTGDAIYTNKEEEMTWNTTGRLKYGLMMSEGYGERKYDLRKNIDQLDISSKFTNKAFGKFDFSATMLFKSQIAKGYNYPNDSVVVSKFFNPATITVGLGLDYKPNKKTSINFAPLSYKATFVPDTANIDQTKHGLLADQRSKHEPGMSVQINHKTELWKMITLSNKVSLFTNYIHNPLNVDIDWEMIATAKLNWFTDVRLNTHLIYDDDTLIPVTDESGNPVLGSDGVQKKVPKVQFKEIVGISIIFRF